MVAISSGSSPLGDSIQTNEIDDSAVTFVKMNGLDLPIGTGFIFMPTIYPSVVNQGTWVVAPNTNYLFSVYLTNTSDANNDSIDFEVYLAKGTYVLDMPLTKNNTGGIIQVNLDGVEIGNFDTYNSSEIFNVQNQETGIVVAENGLKTINIKLNGKHASSSGFKFRGGNLMLYRTA